MRVKPARAQPRGQLLGGVAALAVILEPALPRAVRPQVKEVDIVAAYPAAELRAPDAVGVLRLVEVDLPVETEELLWRVHVENERTAGRDEQVQPLEGALHVAGICQIVETVETADRRVDRSVQVELRHRLVQEPAGGMPGPVLAAAAASMSSDPSTAISS